MTRWLPRPRSSRPRSSRPRSSRPRSSRARSPRSPRPRSPREAALRAIEAWQADPDRPRGLCLHSPTCSVYGHRAISRHGLFIGGLMTAWRVFRCNPCLARRPPPPADR